MNTRVAGSSSNMMEMDWRSKALPVCKQSICDLRTTILSIEDDLSAGEPGSYGREVQNEAGVALSLVSLISVRM